MIYVRTITFGLLCHLLEETEKVVLQEKDLEI